MLDKKLKKELKEKELHLSIKPDVNLWAWELEASDKGKLWYPCEESQVYTEVMLNIVLENENCETVDVVGAAQLWVINSHRFYDDTLMDVDGENGEMFGHLEAIKYYNHEKNYSIKGFDYPYQPFVILNRLFIAEKYRGKGIGQSVIKNANKVVNDILNLDTVLLQWGAWPIAGLHEAVENPSEEDVKRLYKFARKVGAKPLCKIDNLKYFIYKYNELEGLGD